MSKDRINILGAPVDRITVSDVLHLFERFLREDAHRLIFTVDASSIYMSTYRDDVRDVFNRADLITPDGAGVVWAARHKGVPIPERVSGVDLVKHLFALSARTGGRLYLLGAAPGVAEKAAERLTKQFPGSIVVGTHDGYFTKEQEPRLVAQIAAAKPDVLLVAMGVPRQELFILDHRDQIGAKINMGVGGSFDVYSGVAKRAPVWVQRIHCEWLFRLLQDPKKFRRILMLPKFWLAVRRERQ